MQSELDQYDYELPRELIAQAPLPCRSDARLMVVNRTSATIEHRYVRDLPELLCSGDRLVMNDTRVIPAALVGKRTATGGNWQGLFLSFLADGSWRILGKTRGKLAAGETISLLDRAAREDVRLRLIEKQEGGVWVVQPESIEEALRLLDRVGRVPLPHYIRGGDMIDSDRANYQTVYARRPGAVAAPTAGLHLTDELLSLTRQRGVTSTLVTLHVGLGTFRPISASRLSEHVMHSEWGEITDETVEQLKACREAQGRIVAVGTTSVRVLETAAVEGALQPWKGETDLFIRPPYQFQAVDALMTNFHLPRSTLLILVHSFGGDELMRRAYQEAIDQQYRFFSYGDAMLIL